MAEASIVQVLNAELLGLVEYARAKEIEVNMDLLRSAMTAIASLQVSNTLLGGTEYQRPGKKASNFNVEEAKRKDAERIQANMHNDEIWRTISTKIGAAIGGDDAALLSLYKMGGSSLSAFSRDKQIKRDNNQSLSTTNEIYHNHPYFVSVKQVMAKYGDQIVNRQITFDDAMTQYNQKSSILCNYDLEQEPDESGCKYIYGGLEGLLSLAGRKAGRNGVLKVCGMNVDYTSIQPSRRRNASTKYCIKLSPEDAQLFERMIVDDESQLRKLLQLTNVSVAKDEGTTVTAGNDDPDKPDSAQHGRDADVVAGHQKLSEDSVNDFDQRVAGLANSMKSAVSKMKRYMMYPSPRKPVIKLSKFTPSPDADVNLLKQIEYLSEFAVKFGEVFKTEVAVTKCVMGVETFRIANYTDDNYRAVISTLNRHMPQILTEEALADCINSVNSALYAFFHNIQERISSVYAGIKFGDAANSDVSKETVDELSEARKRLNDILTKQYVIESGVLATLQDINSGIQDAINSVGHGESLNDVVPEELVDASDRLAEFTTKLNQNDVPTDEEFVDFIQHDLPIIVEYGVHHYRAKIEWNRLKNIKVTIPVKGSPKTYTIEQVVNDYEHLLHNVDKNFDFMAAQVMRFERYLSSFVADAVSENPGDDYIPKLVRTVKNLANAYPEQKQPSKSADTDKTKPKEASTAAELAVQQRRAQKAETDQVPRENIGVVDKSSRAYQDMSDDDKNSAELAASLFGGF